MRLCGSVKGEGEANFMVTISGHNAGGAAAVPGTAAAVAVVLCVPLHSLPCTHLGVIKHAPFLQHVRVGDPAAATCALYLCSDSVGLLNTDFRFAAWAEGRRGRVAQG